MSDLVGNPEDRFSRVAAQMSYKVMIYIKCIYKAPFIDALCQVSNL